MRLFPLDLADAIAAITTEGFGDLDEAKDIFLFDASAPSPSPAEKKRRKNGGEERRERMMEKRAYIAQILHDVVKPLRLLEIIPTPLDRLPQHQILRNLRPHALPPILLAHKPPPLVQSPLLVHRLGRISLILGDEVAPPHAIVPLPRDVLARATHALHLHAVGARGHVDDGPVAGGAVVGFADIGALGGAAGVVVGFVGDGVVAGSSGWAGGDGAAADDGGRGGGGGGAGFASGVDYDVVVVAVAVVFAAGREG